MKVSKIPNKYQNIIVKKKKIGNTASLSNGNATKTTSFILVYHNDIWLHIVAFIALFPHVQDIWPADTQKRNDTDIRTAD